MSSGQSNEPMQQVPYPAYGMQYQPVHKPTSEYIRSFASDIWLAVGVVAGLFLLMIGSIIYGASETEAWHDVGMVVKALGLFVVTAAMLLGALLRNDMNKWVRVALLLAATLLIILVGFWGPFWGLTVNLDIPGFLL
jgi:hypothetical protein